MRDRTGHRAIGLGLAVGAEARTRWSAAAWPSFAPQVLRRKALARICRAPYVHHVFHPSSAQRRDVPRLALRFRSRSPRRPALAPSPGREPGGVDSDPLWWSRIATWGRPRRSVGGQLGGDFRRHRALRYLWVALLLVSSTGTAAAQSSRLEPLRSSLDRWQRAPEDWDGLSQRSARRFTDRLMEAMGEVDPGRSEAGDPRRPSVETSYREEVWFVALRAAALRQPGVASESLLSIAGEARTELLRLAGTPDSGLQAWAMFDVVGAESHDGTRRASSGRRRPTTEERTAALDILVTARVRAIRAALLMVARRERDPLRPQVLHELARWAERFGADEAVDLFLVELLGTSAARDQVPHPMNVVLDRVDSATIPLGARAQQYLRQRIATMLLSPDWRKAAQAMRLSKGLSVESRVPILLDALNVWDQRSRSDRTYDGLVRIRGDLVRTLREISGRMHGPQPGPWIEWWIAVQKGELPMPGSQAFEAAQEQRAQQPLSTASFFGLRPETDRVTFIIDFSGSMDASWATSGHSRYEEAVEQMMRFLQAAPSTTRFCVILFNGAPIRSSEELVEASPENLEAARRSLLRRSPEGGTLLRPAVALALGLDANGIPDPELSAGDTLVVLCDGQTSGGRAWVKPMLERVLPYYPVVIHSVHLGADDDGALRDLAHGTGGEFVRVGQ